MSIKGLFGIGADDPKGETKPEPGVVEKTTVVEVFIPVGEGVKTVYYAESKSYLEAARKFNYSLEDWSHRRTYADVYGDYGRGLPGPEPKPPSPPDWHGSVFLSCHKAFEAYGDDVQLTSYQAFVHDGRAYQVSHHSAKVME